MLKFLINLLKLGRKDNRFFKLESTQAKWFTDSPRKHYRKSLTYTYINKEGERITKTIEDVEVQILDTTYGKACNVLCGEELEKEEVMAIIRMFL